MENTAVSCKLKVPKDLSTKTPVFLVNFTNGNVNLNNSSKLKFTCFRHVDDENIVTSKVKRVLVANNGRLNYEGANLDGSHFNQSKLRYFVGVRSKTSKKMKIYDSISFHLKPVMKTDLEPTTAEARNLRERLDDLTANFGSKGKKRSMTARQKYSTDIAPLDDAFGDFSLDESIPSGSQTIHVPSTPTNIEYIPPQNRDAKFIQEVYKICDIISPEEDDYLNVEAEVLLQDLPMHFPQWKTDGTYCKYVLQHLENALDKVKVKYLIYYNYLVIFSRLLASDIKKRDPAPEIPEPIKGCLLDRYIALSGKSARCFSQKMKDKLLSYMLVLALIIDDYCVNLALVHDGTKFGMTKIANVAQVLGCYVNRRKIGNSAVQFAELKLPLFVPQKYHKRF